MMRKRMFSIGRFLCQIGFDWDGWWLRDNKGYKHQQLLDVSIVTSDDNIRTLQVTVGWFWCLFAWITVPE